MLKLLYDYIFGVCKWNNAEIENARARGGRQNGVRVFVRFLWSYSRLIVGFAGFVMSSDEPDKTDGVSTSESNGLKIDEEGTAQEGQEAEPQASDAPADGESPWKTPRQVNYFTNWLFDDFRKI